MGVQSENFPSGSHSFKPLLVFDFDGVISNSVHDSFRTALNSFLKLSPENRLPLSECIDPGEAVFDFEKKCPELFDAFYRLMPFGNRAEDYYVILKIIETKQDCDVQDQQSYNAFKNKLSSVELHQYHQAFYHLRRFYQKSPETWSDLLPPFPGVVDAVKKLSKQFTLAIATSKDITSVRIQLKSYGLEDCFPVQQILDKEHSDSKRHHLEALQRSHKLPFDQIRFIDDKVLHLISVADLGIQCYLAKWGFNTPREHVLAKDHGFRLLELKDLSLLK